MRYNQTTVDEFILLGFTNIRRMQLFLFTTLFFSYLLTISGNSVIFIITLRDRRLQTPMYFFLRNFSLLEIGFTTAIIPQTLVHLATDTKKISYIGCLIQSFLYFHLGTMEFFLLAVMSFDRYVAICEPLRYPAIMSNHLCIFLVLCSWFGAFLLIIGPAVLFLLSPISFVTVLH